MYTKCILFTKTIFKGQQTFSFCNIYIFLKVTLAGLVSQDLKYITSRYIELTVVCYLHIKVFYCDLRVFRSCLPVYLRSMFSCFIKHDIKLSCTSFSSTFAMTLCLHCVIEDYISAHNPRQTTLPGPAFVNFIANIILRSDHRLQIKVNF